MTENFLEFVSALLIRNETHSEYNQPIPKLVKWVTILFSNQLQTCYLFWANGYLVSLVPETLTVKANYKVYVTSWYSAIITSINKGFFKKWTNFCIVNTRNDSSTPYWDHHDMKSTFQTWHICVCHSLPQKKKPNKRTNTKKHIKKQNINNK